MIDIKKLKILETRDDMFRLLLKKCYEYSKRSNYPSTKNAAFLLDKQGKILLKGLNVIPQGVKHRRVYFETRENRHLYFNHAERDVIYLAAKRGVKTAGLTMIIPWLPCIPCANAIISSGIKTLIVHKQMIERTREGWQEELKNAVEILKEAKVKIIAYDGVVGAKAYMHKQEWDS